ncbi:MAG: hypothetical protein LH647_03700 [Leptolyngbyaceae cyanobacterium CAN_BIN12]|nr:hypothetical protein [Leptolyngbyaceae cyanobacterium CAN_BIN12]
MVWQCMHLFGKPLIALLLISFSIPPNRLELKYPDSPSFLLRSAERDPTERSPNVSRSKPDT